MEDRDFFELLHQQWAKTTGAENMYWMPQQDDEAPDFYDIKAIDQEGGRKHVASAVADEDADFITAVHGCLPDLIRCLLASMDEAERLDHRVDSQTEHIAELELQVDQLNDDVRAKTDAVVSKDLEIQKLHEELEFKREEVEFWRAR